MKNSIALLALLGTLLFSACGGDRGGDSEPQLQGIFSLHTAGGSGGLHGGYGGNGGFISILKEGGIGDLMIARSGKVDAAFTPSSLSINLGSNPLIITSDTVISIVTIVPPEGTPYLLANNSSLYISDGEKLTGNRQPVTGLRVLAGATLTLGPNFSTWSRLVIPGHVENHGVITTKDISALQRGHLELSTAKYLGTGKIDTVARVDGQSGGNVFVYATGDIIHTGLITTAGASAETGQGGAGGKVEIYAGAVLENTGPIETSGGNAVSGVGGEGGYIDLVGYYGLRNSGYLSTVGGDGATRGGNGGWIWLEVYTEGDLRSVGDINSSGGDSNVGKGGDGGEVDIYAYGGTLRHNAELHTAGGSSQNGHGGQGGSIIFATFQGWNVATPPGDILVSGNLATAGGSAGSTGNGGNGGSVDFYLGNYAEENPTLEKNQRLALLGYQNLDAGGGSGNFGGSGGDVLLLSDHGYSNPGLLSNEAEIVTRGGSVAAGSVILPAHGGKGGNVYLEAYADPVNSANPRGTKVNNAGTIDAVGGEGLESDGRYWWAGSGGEVVLYGADTLTNSGKIATRGGDDRGIAGGVSGFGGEGNWIVLIADGPLVNSGTLDAGGGYGEYRGGGAGGVYLLGLQRVSNSGDLYARGGNARPSLFGSRGGDGGFVEIGLLAQFGDVINTGSVFVQGGAGSMAGIDGALAD
jgi:hypothetical protein